MNIVKPWGKIQFDVERWQPIAEHCEDVAAVFSALLGLDGIRRRLAQLAERQDLDDVTCARLAFLVYLHDFGKVNAGFQARCDPKAPMVGHVKPLVAVFKREELFVRAAEALHLQELDGWGPSVLDDATTGNGLLDAILSHHGKPWSADARPECEARHWAPREGYDPFVALAALVNGAITAFPSATGGEAPPLPATPGFVHAFAGFTQLADWIASGDWQQRDRAAEPLEDWARRRLREIGLDPVEPRKVLNARKPGFTTAFPFTPSDAQTQTAAANGRLVILESETGSGKTEAALWRFVSLFRAGAVDGLYFALPTRIAAMQLHGRVEKLAQRLWPEAADRPAVVLAVPGYLDDANTDGKGALPAARDDLDAVEGDRRDPCVWAAEHPKRYFAATVSVGAIDQALMGAIRVKHAHMRAAMLMRHLLVVDEVHASDAFMRRLLMNLLRDHLAAGGHALLLSATLGAEARAAFLCEAAGGRSRDIALLSLGEAISAPYPLITSANGVEVATHATGGTGYKKDVLMEAVELLDDATAVARQALDAAKRGAKVLVLRNTVNGAVEVQKAIEVLADSDNPLLFRVEGVATLHHGRFAREDRRLLDAEVEKAVGKGRPEGGLVLVGTQTLEQSLDIDADFLITDLCPADVLLQRIGRLHRHTLGADGKPRRRAADFEVPRCIVLTPECGLAPFLGKQRPGGKSRHGLGGLVYQDVVILELSRRLVVGQPVWRIPEMNRHLVENALHREAIESLFGGIDAPASETWRKHWQEVAGTKGAEAQAAAQAALRRDKGFMSQHFDADERLATRLGTKDRIVDLPEGTPGPFGHPIRRIAVPGWMGPNITDEEVFHCSRGHEGSLELTGSPSGISLVYNRLGLSLAKERSG